MADTRNIVITLKNESGNNNSQELNTEEKTDSSSIVAKNSNSNLATSAFLMIGKKAIDVGTREIVAWADYNVNKQFNLHDDYIGQRNMSIAQHYINGAVGDINSVASGAISGFAIGGPIGAVIGGALSGITSIIGHARSNLQGEDQQNIRLKQLDLQLQYTRRRAGWSTHAGSIGEDL